MKVIIDTTKHTDISITEMFYLSICNNIDGVISYREIISLLPELELKEDSVYRILKRLQKKKLIDMAIVEKDLYLMADTDCTVMKIGVSNDAINRLKNINTSNAMQINIIIVSKRRGYKESEAHYKFKDLRLSGEWFKYDQRIIDWFKNL